MSGYGNNEGQAVAETGVQSQVNARDATTKVIKMKNLKTGKQERKPASRKGKKFIARAEVKIYARPGRVWEALVNPDIIRRYMFDTEVVSAWTEGSPISWKGTWEGKHYEDRGVILRFEPERLLSYSHFSPSSGLQERPGIYHTVTIVLSSEEEYTRVILSQDNNLNAEARDHAQKNWEIMLTGLKKVLEGDVIKGLFAEYEKAFAALDIEKNAGFFADTFISAGPRGAIAQSKFEFLKLARQAAEFYIGVGQTSANILSLQETAVSNEYSLVKVHWGVTFRKTGTRMIEFDVSYLIQKIGPEPKIILFIAHEDEEQAMKELGLLEGIELPGK